MTSGFGGEMGEFADYFKTWNWELAFRYSRNEGQDLSIGEVSQRGLRDALLDTNPASAFNPFLGLLGRNSKAARSGVYVTLHNSGEFELPLGYLTFTVTCLIFRPGQSHLRSVVSTAGRE